MGLNTTVPLVLRGQVGLYTTMPLVLWGHVGLYATVPLVVWGQVGLYRNAQKGSGLQSSSVSIREGLQYNNQ